ncbi:Retinal guanylyl cyclase 1 [Homalodisca vitripennis]|nr:Retinal guanylyl cyclase 1 [Homalodisca vitripennis]
MYGRTGPTETPSGGHTPHRYCSEESSSFDLSLEVPVVHQTFSRTRPSGLITQMSLDPQLLESHGKQQETRTDDKPERKRWKRQMTFDQGNVTIHDVKSPEPPVKKSLSTDQKMSNAGQSGISTPFSMSEVNMDLLGISFVNTSKSTTNLNSAGKRVDENDLSTPYNHYRCLSPSDAKPRLGNSSRFLKRQFSVDREDSTEVKSTPRLFKQNSAGAAHDLERIEEVPLKQTNRADCYKHRCELPPLSVSVESLN